jgi:DNA-directed RNA polymerase subunit M/transcription elongation factor TFIIS
MYACPEEGCSFTYNGGQLYAFRTHNNKSHRKSVTVNYINPTQEVVIDRTDGIFRCLRCDTTSVYPTALQVRFYSTLIL